MNLARLLPITIVLFALTLKAQASERVTIDAFLGDWFGVAITEDVILTGTGIRRTDLSLRDLDVSIAATEAGINVTWTASIRLNGKRKTRSNSVALARTAPGVFKGTGTANVLAGETALWARIEEKSLIVYVLEIDPKGVYELSRYERRLTPSGGMLLNFRRLRDGRVRRTVTGKLARER